MQKKKSKLLQVLAVENHKQLIAQKRKSLPQLFLKTLSPCQINDFPDNLITEEIIKILHQQISANPPDIINFPEISKNITSNDPQTVVAALMQFHYLLQRQESTLVCQSLDQHIDKHLFKLISNFAIPFLQHGALVCLINLLSGSCETTTKIIDNGVFEALRCLLKSPFDSIKLDALICLSNIAIDCQNCREKVITSNIMNDVYEKCSQNNNPEFEIEILYIERHILSQKRESQPFDFFSQKILLKFFGLLLVRQSETLFKEIFIVLSSCVNQQTIDYFQSDAFLTNLKLNVDKIFFEKKIDWLIFALPFFNFLMMTFKFGVGQKIISVLGLNYLKISVADSKVNFQVCTIKLLIELTNLSPESMRGICEDINFLDTIFAASVCQNRIINKHATILLAVLCVKADQNTANILLNNGILQLFYCQTKKQQLRFVILEIIEACISLIRVFAFNNERSTGNVVVDSVVNTGLCQKLEMVCNFFEDNCVEKISELKEMCNLME